MDQLDYEHLEFEIMAILRKAGAGRPMIQLYQPAPKDMELDTQYGHITYGAFLVNEKARIERADGRVAELCFTGDAVSLFVNRVAEAVY